MASGIEDLTTLLSTMQPTLDPEIYVFVTTKQPLSSLPLSTLNPQLIAQENEGITIVTTQALAASHDFKEVVFPCQKISLTIHSSLEAIGLIATITDRLKNSGISTNVVSGFFHDHIYVPVKRAKHAMQVLEQLAIDAREGMKTQ